MNTHSIQLNGSSQYLSNASLNWGSGNTWCASMWVKNTSGSNAHRRFFGNSNGALAANHIILREDSSGNINLLVNNGGGNAASSGVTWKGSWHWIAIISDGTNTKVYIDDNDTAIISVAAVSTPFDGLFLGGWYQPSNNEYFEGYMDDVRIYDTNKTIDQLQAEKQQALVGNEANLIAYYKLDNSLLDETSNSYDLTATGSPTFSTSILPYTGATDVSGTAALFDNLLAYYELEEASGTRSDTFAAFDLTDVNTVGSATGIQGTGADFELDNSEYLYNSSTSLNQTGSYSVACWFKLESYGGTNIRRNVVAERSTSNAVGQLVIGVLGNTDAKGTTNDIYAEVWASSGGFLVLDSGVVPVLDTWYHVAFVKAADNDWKLYVNGVLKASSTSSRTLSTTGLAGMCIGAMDQGSGGVGSHHDGLVDEVGFFDAALTETNIRDLWNNGNGLPYVGSIDITMTPSAQVVTASLPSRSILFDNVRAVSAQVVTASLPARTISIKETLTPSAQVATFSIPQYFVLAGDILFQAVAQVVTASIPAYSVLLDRVFGVAAQVATFSVPSRTVSIKETLTPVAQVATFSIPAYSVQFGQTVAVGVQTATFSIPAYSVTAETAVHPSAQVVTFSIPAYSITLGILMTPLTQVLTFTLPTLYKVGAIWTKVARPTNATWSRTSRNSN